MLCLVMKMTVFMSLGYHKTHREIFKTLMRKSTSAELKSLASQMVAECSSIMWK
ncbi:Uncharacterised protein [Vibrio cholerae]|nr:Uncharacterised protein [Vibrio cholerae]